MANDPKNPEVGELVIDTSDLAQYIVDLPPGGLKGLLAKRDGFDNVIAEIIANQPLYGGKAGITGEDFTNIQTSNEVIAKIEARLPAARKLVELLEETLAYHEDQRQRQVYAIGKSVEIRANMHKNPELLAKYESTRRYRSAIAFKGVRTRLRNQAAAESGAGDGGESYPGPDSGEHTGNE